MAYHTRPKPKPITEKKDKALIESWYKRTDAITTPAELTAFINDLTTLYAHDYGTIAHAVTAAALAAAKVVDRSPSGGITGFQAGCIMWEFCSRWMHWDTAPRSLVTFSDMLYPQYEQKFQKTITKETWAWLKKAAVKKLKEKGPVHIDVRTHWQSIVKGQIPFGYTVADKE